MTPESPTWDTSSGGHPHRIRPGPGHPPGSFRGGDGGEGLFDHMACMCSGEVRAVPCAEALGASRRLTWSSTRWPDFSAEPICMRGFLISSKPWYFGTGTERVSPSPDRSFTHSPPLPMVGHRTFGQTPNITADKPEQQAAFSRALDLGHVSFQVFRKAHVAPEVLHVEAVDHSALPPLDKQLNSLDGGELG